MKTIINIVFIFTAIMAVLLSPGGIYAHPGNTASDGCHYCRTRCDYWGVPWNQRHCHNGPISKPPPVVQPTSTPRHKIIYPTWTPQPRPTSIPKPTYTPSPTIFPTITLVPSPLPSNIPIPTIALSSIPIINQNTQDQVQGLSSNRSEKKQSFLELLFQMIYESLFNKEFKLISPVVN